MSHYQIPLKHWSGDIMVDEKIAPLVQKLWDRDIQTDSSCQGNMDRSPAYLMFSMWEEAIEFVQSGIEALGVYDFDLAPFHGETGPRGRVTFHTDLIKKLETIW
ncbi:hypothetical protein [Mycolicibacterium septicum]|uniref:hypothetical protein n=1 Tax=Mycolicibacterium septicum TaxID=98668 RepID=UPI001AF2AE36|nr:hypothetical protein [Mycolicibacterium septicum]QRY51829.1 hypothetical protein JVX95_31395 [Mycolicibacterium septicum]